MNESTTKERLKAFTYNVVELAGEIQSLQSEAQELTNEAECLFGYIETASNRLALSFWEESAKPECSADYNPMYLPIIYEIKDNGLYGLLPWYQYMPVAIEVRPLDEAGRHMYVDRHYPTDIGFETPAERIAWAREGQELTPEHRWLIIEQGKEWADFVASDVNDALQTWAEEHEAWAKAYDKKEA